jgi:hypothetical protein
MISMEQAANLLPNPPCRSTMYRWCTEGVNGVRLMNFKIGRQRVTTVDYFLQFIEQLNDVKFPGTGGESAELPPATTVDPHESDQFPRQSTSRTTPYDHLNDDDEYEDEDEDEDEDDWENPEDWNDPDYWEKRSSILS